MKYIILDKETEKTLNEIQKRIHRLQNWGSIDSLNNMGIGTQQQVGASFVSLKTLAEQYPANERVATILWNTRKREEQIIACFLFPGDTNREKITQSIQTCYNEELAEYFGSVFLSRHKELADIINTWINSSVPHMQIAALTAGARHLIINRTAPLISVIFFKELANKEYEDKYVQLVARRYR